MIFSSSLTREECFVVKEGAKKYQFISQTYPRAINFILLRQNHLNLWQIVYFGHQRRAFMNIATQLTLSAKRCRVDFEDFWHSKDLKRKREKSGKSWGKILITISFENLDFNRVENIYIIYSWFCERWIITPFSIH